jgi:hypothetical protein
LAPVLIAALPDASSEERPRGLAEGTINISRSKNARTGPSTAKLVRVWQYEGKQVYDESEWLKKEYGAKHVVYLRVEGTSYSILIVDGLVTPLVKVNGPYEIWKIDGLEGFCKRVIDIETTAKKLTLRPGSAELAQTVQLDFSQGCAITYTEKYHLP